MKIMSFFWTVNARYSVRPNSFTVAVPLFDSFSKADSYRYTVSVHPTSKELVIDAIKNVDIQYKNGESRTGSTRKHESNGRAELS